MQEVEQSLDLDTSNIKLTKWEKEPTVRDLKKDLLEAQSDHDNEMTKVDGYLDNLYVRGSAKVKAPKGRSQLVPKLIRKHAEWRYPALSEPYLSRDNLFEAKPVTWADKEGAEQNKMVLNAQFNFDINKTAFIDEYVRTGVDEGTIICRVGWDFQEEEYEAPLVEFVVNPEFAGLHEELAQLKAENPPEYFSDVPEELREAHDLTMEMGEPIEPVVSTEQSVKKMRTLVNRPTIEVCDYRNVIIDPTCKGDLNKAGFIIYSFESSKAELEKDGKYKNLDQIVASTNGPLSQPDHNTDNHSNFTFNDEPRKKLVVYEYWGFRDVDGSGKLTPFVAAWVGETLIQMEENPYPDSKLPFVVVQYLPVRKSIYGEPDGALLDDNQKVMGATTRGIMDILGRSANGQMGTRKDALDAVNKRRFRNGEHYEFNGNTDPRQAMYMHTFPEIPNSAQFMLQQQAMEAESLTGVKSYDQGVSGSSLGDVAAGVRGALDAASKRELGILRRLSCGLVEIGRKIMAMNAEFLEEDEVVRITDEEFVVISREKLAGHHDLILDITTAEEDEKKAGELAFMLQTMGPKEDPAIRIMILADIAKLRKMPALAKKLEDYKPEPDPIQQQIQMLELKKLAAEIEEINSRTAENYAEAELDKAAASNKDSDTDLKNLNFVEQESGVTQERDLQKSGEQARSQVQLKLLDNELKQGEDRKKKLNEYISSK